MCTRTTGKKLVISTKGKSENKLEKLDAMLNSFRVYLHTDLTGNLDLEPFASMEGTDLEAISSTIDNYLDRLKFEYGRVANTNPKGERMTSGENYKDISAIANRQKETLEYMINFAYMAQDLWGIQLEFAVSGIPEKEAIHTISHMAQTPNMEKEMFGQIEGTQPRPPVGVAGKRKSNKQIS